MERVSIERGDGIDEICAGIIQAEGCQNGPSSPALLAALDEAIRAAAAPEDEATRQAVRGMLRFGSYKPTGRGKPASEYLLGAARDGSFPRVSALVDLNNLGSLEALLPASILDLARAGTRRFLLRRGRPGESYVFNHTGQTIELRDLLLAATLPGDEPCVNAVKDAMRTKVQADTREVLVIVYGTRALRARVEEAASRFAARLQAFAGASEAAWWLA